MSDEDTVFGRKVRRWSEPSLPPNTPQHYCITNTAMSSSPDQAAAAAAHSFNKILNQHKSSKSRRSGDADEGLKKLRRMILVEGIPSKIVRSNVAMDKLTVQ